MGPCVLHEGGSDIFNFVTNVVVFDHGLDPSTWGTAFFKMEGVVYLVVLAHALSLRQGSVCLRAETIHGLGAMKSYGSEP